MNSSVMFVALRKEADKAREAHGECGKRCRNM